MQKREIKLFFLNVLKFGTVAITVYLASVFLMCKIYVSGKPIVYRACQGLVWKGGYTYERFKEFDPSKKYDILIFGSSRANRGINPRVFEEYGYIAYNLGTDDLTPYNAELLVKLNVKRGHCKLVIIDIFDKMFSQSNLESTADLIQNIRENKSAVRMAVASKDIRSINSLCVRMMLRNTSPLYESSTDLYKGFRELHNDSVSFTSNFIPYKKIDGNLCALDRTLTYLESINVPYLLVSQPMIFHTHVANHNLFLKDVEPIIKKHGAQYYDYTDKYGIILSSDYADECHLTSQGAYKYTKYLVENHVSKLIKSGLQN